MDNCFESISTVSIENANYVPNALQLIIPFDLLEIDLLNVGDTLQQSTNQEEKTRNTDLQATTSPCEPDLVTVIKATICAPDLDTVIKIDERSPQHKWLSRNLDLNVSYDKFYEKKTPEAESEETLNRNNDDSGDQVADDEPNETLETCEDLETTPVENKAEVCDEIKVEHVEIEKKNLFCNEHAMVETKLSYKPVQVKPIPEILNVLNTYEPLSPVDEEITMIDPPPLKKVKFKVEPNVPNLPLEMKLLERDEFRTYIINQPVIILEKLSQDLIAKAMVQSSPSTYEPENQLCAEPKLTTYEENCRPAKKLKLVASKKKSKSTEDPPSLYSVVSDFRQIPRRKPKNKSKRANSTTSKPTALVTGGGVVAETSKATVHSGLTDLSSKRKKKKEIKRKASKEFWEIEPQYPIGFVYPNTEGFSSKVSKFPYSDSAFPIPQYLPPFKIKKVDRRKKSVKSVYGESPTRKIYLQQQLSDPIEYVSPLQHIYDKPSRRMKEQNRNRRNKSGNNTTRRKFEKSGKQTETVDKCQSEIRDLLRNALNCKLPSSSVIPNRETAYYSNSFATVSNATAPRSDDSSPDEAWHNKRLEPSVLTSGNVSTSKDDVFDGGSLSSGKGQNDEIILDIDAASLCPSDLNSTRSPSGNISLVGSSRLENIWNGTWEFGRSSETTLRRSTKPLLTDPVIEPILPVAPEIPPQYENTQITLHDVPDFSPSISSVNATSTNKSTLLQGSDLFTTLTSSIIQPNSVHNYTSHSTVPSVNSQSISTEKPALDSLMSVIVQNLLNKKPMLSIESVQNLSENDAEAYYLLSSILSGREKELLNEIPLSSSCSNASEHGATTNQVALPENSEVLLKLMRDIAPDETALQTIMKEIFPSPYNYNNEQPLTPTMERLSTNINSCNQTVHYQMNINTNNTNNECNTFQNYDLKQMLLDVAHDETALQAVLKEILPGLNFGEQPISPHEVCLSTNENSCDQMNRETNILLSPNSNNQCSSSENYNLMQLVNDIASDEIAVERVLDEVFRGLTAPDVTLSEGEAQESFSDFDKQPFLPTDGCLSAGINLRDQLHIHTNNDVRQLKGVLVYLLNDPSSILQIDQERRSKTESLIQILNELENNDSESPVSSTHDNILAPIMTFGKELIELSELYNFS